MKTFLFASLAATFFFLIATTFAATPGRGTRGPATAPATGPAAPRIKLWEKTPLTVAGPDTDPNPLEPTIDVYLPPAERVPAAGAPAIIVFPGGSYVNLSMVNEGSGVARAFMNQGMAAFVLRYRHAPRYKHPIPLMDAQRAIRTVRAKAAEFKVNPDRVGILGFSAGGHLAASAATMFDTGPKPESPDAVDGQSAKPAFAILMYPVINMTEDNVTHRGSRTNLTGEDTALYAELSADKRVTKETPPLFIVHGTNDRTVPVMNAVLMYEAALKNTVPVEMHIFENGPHGFGINTNDPALREWPEMAAKWLVRRGILTR